MLLSNNRTKYTFEDETCEDSKKKTGISAD